MRYQAGKDITRAAPVLIGKIGWTPGRPAGGRKNSTFWMVLIVGVMFLISSFRWIHGLRRSLTRRSHASSPIRRPTDEIAPDDLAQWVESVQEEEGGAEPDRRGDDRP